jgi:predicted DNA binding CopG/RHH family protein
MAGPKDAQVVVRMPSALLEAVKAHQRAMQAERPFERVTAAVAIRDLLARGLTSTAKPKKRR